MVWTRRCIIWQSNINDCQAEVEIFAFQIQNMICDKNDLEKIKCYLVMLSSGGYYCQLFYSFNFQWISCSSIQLCIENAWSVCNHTLSNQQSIMFIYIWTILTFIVSNMRKKGSANSVNFVNSRKKPRKFKSKVFISNVLILNIVKVEVEKNILFYAHHIKLLPFCAFQHVKLVTTSRQLGTRNVIVVQIIVTPMCHSQYSVHVTQDITEV